MGLALIQEEFAVAKKILIVDDEADIRSYLEALLRDNGYETATAPDGGLRPANWAEPSSNSSSPARLIPLNCMAKTTSRFPPALYPP